MYTNVDPKHCNPPGTFLQTVPDPGGSQRNIEKAIIMEHRFAFFFWMKWIQKLRDRSNSYQPPALVTIDWHRDLAPPTDQLKTDLEQLDQSNLSDIANFVWARFDQTNDGHILCAAWLNLIGDVILLQNTTSKQQHTFHDMHGNSHTIYEFKAYSQFEEFLVDRNDNELFFDIDLDYFIHGKGSDQYSDDFHRYADEEIKRIMNVEKPAFRYLLPKIEGVTVALEPSYCGGIANSCHIMKVVQNQLFTSQNKWRHLSPED
jgi:hypothetical protein